MAFVCEKSVGPERTCDFRSGKVILQQPIEREQMQKLLESGRTDLLKNFVSNKTRRKFSAFLVRGKDGKVGFEFEKREPKVPAKTAAKAATGKSAEKASPAPAEKPATRKAAPKKATAAAKKKS
jgi:DNA topoisomerase-3